MIVPEPRRRWGKTKLACGEVECISRTSMADYQISTLVILLERRLESPYACLEVSGTLPMVVGIPAEVRSVEI